MKLADVLTAYGVKLLKTFKYNNALIKENLPTRNYAMYHYDTDSKELRKIVSVKNQTFYRLFESGEHYRFTA